MRSVTLWIIALILVLAAPAAFAAGTGNGEIQVNTNTTVVGAIAANTTFSLVGWTPVVNSMSASFGSINAYINCNGCFFADVGATQNFNAHVGQFTAAAGPPIIVYPAWQQNGPMNLNNSTASTKTITFGCVGGAVTGACLFNVRTIPTADPLF